MHSFQQRSTLFSVLGRKKEPKPDTFQCFEDSSCTSGDLSLVKQQASLPGGSQHESTPPAKQKKGPMQNLAMRFASLGKKSVHERKKDLAPVSQSAPASPANFNVQASTPTRGRRRRRRSLSPRMTSPRCNIIRPHSQSPVKSPRRAVLDFPMMPPLHIGNILDAEQSEAGECGSNCRPNASQRTTMSGRPKLLSAPSRDNLDLGGESVVEFSAPNKENDQSVVEFSAPKKDSDESVVEFKAPKQKSEDSVLEFTAPKRTASGGSIKDFNSPAESTKRRSRSRSKPRPTPEESLTFKMRKSTHSRSKSTPRMTKSSDAEDSTPRKQLRRSPSRSKRYLMTANSTPRSRTPMTPKKTRSDASTDSVQSKPLSGSGPGRSTSDDKAVETKRQRSRSAPRPSSSGDHKNVDESFHRLLEALKSEDDGSKMERYLSKVKEAREKTTSTGTDEKKGPPAKTTSCSVLGSFSVNVRKDGGTQEFNVLDLRIPKSAGKPENDLMSRSKSCREFRVVKGPSRRNMLPVSQETDGEDGRKLVKVRLVKKKSQRCVPESDGDRPRTPSRRAPSVGRPATPSKRRGRSATPLKRAPNSGCPATPSQRSSRVGRSATPSKRSTDESPSATTQKRSAYGDAPATPSKRSPSGDTPATPSKRSPIGGSSSTRNSGALQERTGTNNTSHPTTPKSPRRMLSPTDATKSTSSPNVDRIIKLLDDITPTKDKDSPDSQKHQNHSYHLEPRKSFRKLLTQDHKMIEGVAKDASENPVGNSQTTKDWLEQLKSEASSGKAQPDGKRTPEPVRRKVQSSKTQSPRNSPGNDRSPKSAAVALSEPRRGVKKSRSYGSTSTSSSHQSRSKKTRSPRSTNSQSVASKPNMGPRRAASLRNLGENSNNSSFGEIITVKPKMNKETVAPSVTAAQLTIPGMESGQTLGVQYEDCPKYQYGENSIANLNFDPNDV